MPKTTIPRQLLVVVAILSLGLVAYSQAVAYWGDESLHLIAGQLIAAGQRPYSDFFYQHPPLFAYLVAGLLRVFGENWRVVHLQSRGRARRVVRIGRGDRECLLLVFPGAGCLGFIFESPVVIERIGEKRNSRKYPLIECDGCRIRSCDGDR